MPAKRASVVLPLIDDAFHPGATEVDGAQAESFLRLPVTAGTATAPHESLNQ
jgi:hypothetical protein